MLILVHHSHVDTIKWHGWIELPTWWDALGYAPIPIAISQTDSGLIPHENEAIITDVDRPRPCSGPIIADHTIGNRWTAHKSTVSTSRWVCCPTLTSKVCLIASCRTQIYTQCTCKCLFERVTALVYLKSNVLMQLQNTYVYFKVFSVLKCCPKINCQT